MRRVLRKIASNKLGDLGDTSTLVRRHHCCATSCARVLEPGSPALPRCAVHL